MQSSSLGSAAYKDVPTSGNASSSQVVMGNDSRLTDSRTPTSHTHTKSQITDFPTLGTASSKDVAASGDANSTQVVMGNDTRLTDSRTPTSHTHTKSQITDFPTLGTAASKDVPVSGNASVTQVVMGSDTRLSDSRAASDVYPWAKKVDKPTYTASEVGAVATTAVGAANGVASLDSSGKVPSSQLPSMSPTLQTDTVNCYIREGITIATGGSNWTFALNYPSSTDVTKLKKMIITTVELYSPSYGWHPCALSMNEMPYFASNYIAVNCFIYNIRSDSFSVTTSDYIRFGGYIIN